MLGFDPRHLIGYAAYLLVGRLLIWTIQATSGPRRLWQWSSLLTELVECDFCLGFWIYLVFSLVLRYNVIEAFILALVSSFIMHLVVLGWRSKFGTTIIG